MPFLQLQVYNNNVHKYRYFCINIISFLNIVLKHCLFYHSSVYRLLLMEEYDDRVLVHPLVVRNDEQIWERTGAPANHDPGEPQGGSRVWVYLALSRLSCKETNPMHCVYADQRDVFLLLMSDRSSSNIRNAWGRVLLVTYFSLHFLTEYLLKPTYLWESRQAWHYVISVRKSSHVSGIKLFIPAACIFTHLA